MQGKMFLNFLSLILYSEIEKTLSEKKMFKNFSLKEIISELKKIKRIDLDENNYIISELSKKHKEIFNDFEIPLPI